jgi:hypothetical protein
MTRRRTWAFQWPSSVAGTTTSVAADKYTISAGAKRGLAAAAAAAATAAAAAAPVRTPGDRSPRRDGVAAPLTPGEPSPSPATGRPSGLSALVEVRLLRGWATCSASSCTSASCSATCFHRHATMAAHPPIQPQRPN